jgi:subtilisin family serine protease
MDVPTAVHQMSNDPSVEYAQPNYRYYALGSACSPVVPTDVYYSTPYYWPLTIIQAPQAWTFYSNYAATVVGPVVGCPAGLGVTIAVLDSGISRNHPDLENVPPIGYNAICDVQEQDSSCVCGSPVTDFGTYFASADDFGHGTYVSGIMNAVWNGSTPNNETACHVGPTSGIAGLAPGSILLAVKVLDCTGSGTTDSIVAGTDFAVAHGAKVLNFSLGSLASGGLDPAEKEALDNAIANGCVIVAAAGNESNLPQTLAPLDFPAAYPPVIAVGATDSSDQIAFYSNGGANLDLMAPGGAGEGQYSPALDVFSSFLCPLSTAAFQEGGFSPFTGIGGDSNFGTAAGTSAATPFVSATAALIWSLYPNLTSTQVIQAIINNTDSLNGNSGWNAQTGYGRLNVYRALLNAGNGGGQVTAYVKTFNSPNPFYTGNNGTTNITLAISQPAPVELNIYDSSGETVLRKNYGAADLNNNPSDPQFKSYYVSWDGKNGSGQPVITGVYFYSVKVNGQIGRNKIALIQGTK